MLLKFSSDFKGKKGSDYFLFLGSLRQAALVEKRLKKGKSLESGFFLKGVLLADSQQQVERQFELGFHSYRLVGEEGFSSCTELGLVFLQHVHQHFFS